MKHPGLGPGAFAAVLLTSMARIWREAADQLPAAGFERFLDLYVREGCSLQAAFDGARDELSAGHTSRAPRAASPARSAPPLPRAASPPPPAASPAQVSPTVLRRLQPGLEGYMPLGLEYLDYQSLEDRPAALPTPASR